MEYAHSPYTICFISCLQAVGRLFIVPYFMLNDDVVLPFMSVLSSTHSGFLLFYGHIF